MVIVKGCRFWYAQYYQKGRQIRVSTKTTVKQEAKAILRKLMGDRDNGLAPISNIRKVRYGDLRQALIESYISQGDKSLKSKANGEEYVAGLTVLDEFFGYKVNDDDTVDKGVSVTQITTDEARRFEGAP